MLLLLLPDSEEEEEEEGAGRASKLARDSLIAAYKLVVLIARSVAKSEREGERGVVGEVKWAAAAGDHSPLVGEGVRVGGMMDFLTVVEYNARFAPLLSGVSSLG